MIAQLFRIVSMLILAYASAFAWGADTAQHKLTDGIDVFYGVVPAEIVQGHVKQLGAERMHGKTPFFAQGTQHLVVTLYDVKTSEHINDAKVSATVTPLGLASETKTLIMKINNTISYGNYFSMSPGNAPYRVVLSIKRPTSHVSATTEFEYR